MPLLTIHWFKSLVFPTLLIGSLILSMLTSWQYCHLVYDVLFFWILADPSRLNFSFILIVSLWQDILDGYIFGMHALLYIVFIGFLVSQKRHIVHQGFWLIWCVFSITHFAISALQALINYYFYGYTLTASKALLQNIVPIILFPIVFQVSHTLYLMIIKRDG